MVNIILANPRGFCAGVERAIEIVERALKKYGSPVYVRHEIVHNKYVVEDLRRKGAVFVEEIDEIPEGAITIFSAHGVSEGVENYAENKGLKVIDATCPLVRKVHMEAQNLEARGLKIIMIGHEGHPEVIGTSGRVKNPVILVSSISDVEKIEANPEDKFGYVTQTTLSVDETREIIEALQARFPNIIGPKLKDICYATQNRQNAVKDLSNICDMILVIGSKNSSNSNRLRNLAEECGVKSYLIDNSNQIDNAWFQGVNNIGITAGASAPEILVNQVVDHIQIHIPNSMVTTMDGIIENIKFKLPKELIELE